MKKIKIAILIIGSILVFCTILVKPEFSAQVAQSVILLIGENNCSCVD